MVDSRGAQLAQWPDKFYTVSFNSTTLFRLSMVVSSCSSSKICVCVCFFFITKICQIILKLLIVECHTTSGMRMVAIVDEIRHFIESIESADVDFDFATIVHPQDLLWDFLP